MHLDDAIRTVRAEIESRGTEHTRVLHWNRKQCAVERCETEARGCRQKVGRVADGRRGLIFRDGRITARVENRKRSEEGRGARGARRDTSESRRHEHLRVAW